MLSLIKHKTKRGELFKFLLLLCVLLVYFGFLSWKYGLATGGIVSALTWSFFVLCTPVADAGFLLDFPVRLLTGIRMWVTELCVWLLAFIINFTAVMQAPEAYDKTFLTSLLYKILLNPWPYWSIIAVCAAGTFLSIRFGDDVVDAIAHKGASTRSKYRMGMMAVLFAVMVWAYYHLLTSLGIHLPSEN